MKANELRIGNLIKIGGNTLNTYQIYTPTKVTLAILNEIAGENEERPDAELSVFMPIPLTEEWMLKFGFKDFDIGRFLELEYPVYKQTDNARLSIYTLNNIDFISCLAGKDIIEIKYVHQLQNLYFALTGEELTIK